MFGGCTTHVEGGVILGQLAPSKLRWIAFPEPEHLKHVSNPSCHMFYDAGVQFVCMRIDVYIGARDQVPQDVNGTWCIKGIAECFSESILGLTQSFRDV
jgi:hypothetical protein